MEVRKLWKKSWSAVLADMARWLSILSKERENVGFWELLMIMPISMGRATMAMR
jgi:hypothetical protein